ncbi:MAG: YdcF family protein [Alphaproteobacteria bacterium]
MKEFIEIIVLPPTSLFILGGAGLLLLLLRVRFGAFLCVLALIVLYALSTPAVARAIAAPLVVAPALAPERFEDDVGAIVILGAGRYRKAPEFGGDTIRGAGLERVRYGAWLHRKTGRPLLVSGGDPDSEGVPEASLMKQALENEFGVPVAWIESASVDTQENAQLSHAILVKAGIRKIYLVTHAEHMRRAVEAFEKTGLAVVPAPTILPPTRAIEAKDFIPSGGGMSASAAALHEWLGRVWYALA